MELFSGCYLSFPSFNPPHVELARFLNGYVILNHFVHMDWVIRCQLELDILTFPMCASTNSSITARPSSSTVSFRFYYLTSVGNDLCWSFCMVDRRRTLFSLSAFSSEKSMSVIHIHSYFWSVAFCVCFESPMDEIDTHMLVLQNMCKSSLF